MKQFEQPVPRHWDAEDGIEMANRCLEESRDQLAMPTMSDLHLANAQFLVSRYSLDLIAYQTAAKERIRWLSAQLARANVLLGQIREQCLFVDDDGETRVTEEPHVSIELFGHLCDHLKGQK